MSGVGLGVGLRRRRSLRWRWRWSFRMRRRQRSWSMGCQSLLLWTWGTLFIIRSQKRFTIHQFIYRFIIHL